MAEATRTDVLRVRDVMQRDPVTIEWNASAQDLAELLSYHGIGGVPVVERGTRVLGMVSATDIVRLSAEQHEAAIWFLDESGQPKPSAYFAAESPRIVRGLVECSLAGFRVEDIMMPATFSVREEAKLPELAAYLVKASQAFVVTDCLGARTGLGPAITRQRRGASSCRAPPVLQAECTRSSGTPFEFRNGSVQHRPTLTPRSSRHNEPTPGVIPA
jgi:CBS-domain-containing membrane protein